MLNWHWEPKKLSHNGLESLAKVPNLLLRAVKRQETSKKSEIVKMALEAMERGKKGLEIGVKEQKAIRTWLC